MNELIVLLSWLLTGLIAAIVVADVDGEISLGGFLVVFILGPIIWVIFALIALEIALKPVFKTIIWRRKR